MYLDTMASRLVNMRLDDARVRKAQALRKRGVSLSSVVREAIDDRFAAVCRTGSRRDVRAIMRRIFERYPDPPGPGTSRLRHPRPAGRACGNPAQARTRHGVILIDTAPLVALCDARDAKHRIAWKQLASLRSSTPPGAGRTGRRFLSR
jgi:hypothetical protein